MDKNVKFNKTTEKIWNNLINKTHNPNGTAALMGAMYAASNLKPNLVNTHGLANFPRMDNYTSMTNNGNRPMSIFVNDGYSYGICQWEWWASKQGLYNIAKKEKKSIGSLDLQLDFLWDELHMDENKKTYYILKTDNNLETCACSAFDYIISHKKDYSDGVELNDVLDYTFQFYNHYTNNNKEIKNKIIEKNKNKKILVALANNVMVRIADYSKAKDVGALRTDISYEYIMSNEKKTWHCIVFEGKLRWVSSKNTRVIDA